MRKINRAEIPSLLKAKQKVTIVSKGTGKPDTIFVISSRGVHDNFISRNVIGRFGFAARLDTATVSSLFWDSKYYTSTGEFVELSFPLPNGDEGVAQRFIVLDNPPFDMLLSGPAIRLPPLNNRKALLK